MKKSEIRILVTNTIEQVTKDYLVEIFEGREVVFITYDDYRRGKVTTHHIDIVTTDGTQDISPEFYSEIVGKFTQYNYTEDGNDYNTMYAGRSRGAFVLGFEKGAHMLTAMSGGCMIQHVENHKSAHSIEIPKYGINLQSPSNHHQMMYPYELQEHQYELIAHSRYFKSETYLTGKNEEKELDKAFLEPEIVYYANTKGLAIQGHPMKEGTNGGYKSVVRDLIMEYFEKRNEQRNKAKRPGLVVAQHRY